LAVSDSLEPSNDVVTAVEETDSKPSSVNAKVGDVTRRLKPAASAAESVVAQTASAAETVAYHTVHLSARGLNRIDAYLMDRQEQRRQAKQEADALPPTASAIDQATDQIQA
jgi:hypothetical protein